MSPEMPAEPSTDTEHDTLDALLRSQPALWRGRERTSSDEAIATGFRALDDALPAHGWGVGSTTELLIDQEGIGEFSLLLPALAQITNINPNEPQARWAALVQPPHVPYAPALANAGVQLEHLMIIDTRRTECEPSHHPGLQKNSHRNVQRHVQSNMQKNSEKHAHDAILWATEQLLRSGVVALVVAWVQRSSAQQLRRLQIAAEAGRCAALLYRPARVAPQPSPAATRLHVRSAEQPQHGLSLEILKARGSGPRHVHIQAHEFDRPQGTEWPGAPA